MLILLIIGHQVLSEVCAKVKSYGTYWKNGDKIQISQNLGSFASGGNLSLGLSMHAKGLAIDINNAYAPTINGVTYKPYAQQGGKGSSAFSQYKKYLCDMCDGNYKCNYNINYRLYVDVFSKHGWCWGGFWGNADPMHFEYSVDNGKQTYNCGSAPMQII